MKRAMIAKFSYLKDNSDKVDKHWRIVTERVNNTGRNLVLRLKEFLKKQNSP